MMAQEDTKDVQSKAWDFSGSVGLNMTGNGLVSWASGGRSSFSALAFGRLKLRYDSLHILWETHLNLEYGAMWKDQDYDKYQGTNDKIDFNTRFGYEMGEKVYISAYCSFQTQFAPTYKYTDNAKPDYCTGKFLAPAYFDIGLGVDYSPFSWLSVYVSPATYRMTTVVVSNSANEYMARKGWKADHPEGAEPTEDYKIYWDRLTGTNAWGLEKALKDKYNVWNYADNGTRDYSSNTKGDVGLMIRTDVNYCYKKLKVGSMLELYTPYRWDKRPVYYKIDDNDHKVYFIEPSSKEIKAKDLQWEGYYDNNRRFFNFDVKWEVSVNYSILKVLEIAVFSDLRYINGLKLGNTSNGETKENIEFGHEKVQWKCTFGIGVGYTF